MPAISIALLHHMDYSIENLHRIRLSCTTVSDNKQRVFQSVENWYSNATLRILLSIQHFSLLLMRDRSIAIRSPVSNRLRRA